VKAEKEEQKKLAADFRARKAAAAAVANAQQ
jgi:hypothetical protein